VVHSVFTLKKTKLNKWEYIHPLLKNLSKIFILYILGFYYLLFGQNKNHFTICLFKMKVLVIVGQLPTKERPWIQPFVKSQIESLEAIGIDVKVLNLAENFKDNWIKYIKGILLLRKILRESSFDIIHAHYSLCGIISLFQRSTPVVVSLMGSDILPVPEEKNRNKFKNKFEQICGKIIFILADHIIVKSKGMIPKVRYGKEKINVVPNGVNLKKFIPFDKNLSREKLNLPKGKKIILFASNPISIRKNFNLAQKAVNKLIANFDEEILLWNPWPIDHELMPMILSASDVLVFTSYFEGSPNLIKEAMACNLPIVSVPVGDVVEMISDIKNCYVVDYDSQEIANYLHKALTNNTRSNGREKMLDLDLENIALKIKQIYEKTLIKKQRS